MKPTKFFITILMATMIIMSSSLVVFAGGGEVATAKIEEVSIPTIEAKNEDIPLTPDGNLSMIDDVIVTDETHKQFIIAQSKNGNYFYIVIDRTKNSENVYLLNMVDEADLIALVTGETVPLEPTTPPVTVEPEILEEIEDIEPVDEETSKNNGILILVLVLGLGGLGGAYYFFFIKGKNTKPDTSSNIDFDGDDDDEEDTYNVEDAFGSEIENEEDDYYDDNDTEVV